MDVRRAKTKYNRPLVIIGKSEVLRVTNSRITDEGR